MPVRDDAAMPAYIDAAVNDLRESDADDEAALLLGVDGDRSEVAARVEALGGAVDARLGRATLRVIVPESAVDAVCELDGLTSIERDRDDVQVLDQGNGHSRRRVTRY